MKTRRSGEIRESSPRPRADFSVAYWQLPYYMYFFEIYRYRLILN